MNRHTITELHELQALPLSLKIRKTKQRLREAVDHFGLDGVYVSFSGGKDSTALLTIAREMYPDIKAVFVDTGLEYPEIREFVKTWDNVDWIKPKLTFGQVIEKYGYPFISKEVSECVYGARKFLTSVAEEISIDRPTDRCHIVTDTKKYADLVCLHQRGGAKREYGTERQDPVHVRVDENAWHRKVWSAVKEAERRQLGGGGRIKDFANLTGTRAKDGRVDSNLYGQDGDDGEYP